MSEVTQNVILTIASKQGSFKKLPSKIITGISVDSRTVKPGDLFFALPGAKTDGHNFIKEALQKGAVGIVTKNMPNEIASDIGILLVDDCLKCLQNMASELLRYVSPSVIGITGSLGKTTTKEFVKVLLQTCGLTVATEGSCNSQIGLALSTLNALLHEKDKPRWFVAEMGMSEKGHISKLVSIVPPEIALVTNIAPVHVQYFSGVQEIAEAKAEIFKSSRCRTSLINSDTPYADILLKAAKGLVKTISMKKKADYTLSIEPDSIIFDYEGKKARFKKPSFPAQHQFENLLHALATAYEAGGDVSSFEGAISALQMLPKRLEFIKKEGILFINDSYNASEVSMIAALEVLKTTKGKRKIAVLGQMKELGAFSKGCHERVGLKAKEICDILICLGEECEPLFTVFKGSRKACYWVSTLNEIHTLLPQLVEKEDIVLLKGSKSNKLWEVVETFSEGINHVPTH
jgi:UDP-N-acetylmuramoyl-tripeptide--D-alanyl-D-alanine ligase